MRLAALLCFCTPAWADGHVASAGGDTILIREAPGVVAEVVYSNSIGMVSTGGWYVVEIEGIVADVHIRVGNAAEENRETVTVVPRDPGLVAYPAEMSILDGEVAVIAIIPPLS